MTLLRASNSTSRRVVIALAVALAVLAAFSAAEPARAEGIPEPSVLFYGTITTRNALVEQGTIQMTFVPVAGGQSITVAGPVAKITSPDTGGGTYSYKLKVPIETVMYGMSLSQSALPVSDGGKAYTRTAVISALGGTKTFQSTSTMGASAQRGTAQRLDFDVTGIGGAMLPSDIIPVILGQEPPQDVMDLNADQTIDAADIIRSAPR